MTHLKELYHLAQDVKQHTFQGTWRERRSKPWGGEGRTFKPRRDWVQRLWGRNVLLGTLRRLVRLKTSKRLHVALQQSTTPTSVKLPTGYCKRIWKQARPGKPVHQKLVWEVIRITTGENMDRVVSRRPRVTPRAAGQGLSCWWQKTPN